MKVGILLRTLSLATAPWFAVATALPLQVEVNSDLPISEPFRFALSIDDDSYSRISDSVDDTKEPHSLLTLHLSLRFINQTNKVVKLDTNCIRLFQRVVYDNPLVGPSEALLPPGERRAITLQGCPYAADEKLLRLLPGESFETTQEVTFGVVSLGAFQPPVTLKPGGYFLQLSELTWWEIDGQDQTLKEERKKPGSFTGRVVSSELTRFVVKGKPVKRQV
jgi:hypothetical protein